MRHGELYRQIKYNLIRSYNPRKYSTLLPKHSDLLYSLQVYTWLLKFNKTRKSKTKALPQLWPFVIYHLWRTQRRTFKIGIWKGCEITEHRTACNVARARRFVTVWGPRLHGGRRPVRCRCPLRRLCGTATRRGRMEYGRLGSYA